LIFRRIDELAALINDPQRPFQFIFAGKAHPADEPGKQLIKKIAKFRLQQVLATVKTKPIKKTRRA